MTRRWCAIAIVLASCADPDAPVDEAVAAIGSPAPMVGDSCTPQPWIFASCASALAATNQTSGCFSIVVPGTSTTVARNCVLHRVLVMQVSNDGTIPAAPTATYLSDILDSLVQFVDTSSYGRVVMSVDVAGPGTTQSWYTWTGDDPPRLDFTSLLQPGDADSLDSYDFFTTLVTGGGKDRTINCRSGKSCNIIHKYRTHTVPGVTLMVNHELGHSLGFKHDHAISTLTGSGVATSPLDGRVEDYGGRSSEMGKDTHAAYNLDERIHAGWLNDGQPGAGRHVVEVASGTQTVTFADLEPNIEEIKGVRIPVTGGYYTIEARHDPEVLDVLRAGVILHYVDATTPEESSMVDGTPETPSNNGEDAVLPVGRTFADAARGVYITALERTETGATVEVVRDPIDANGPIISSLGIARCAGTAPPCAGAPTPAPGYEMWRYSVSATDADGDPLSYLWRFGIGTNGSADTSSYLSGTVVYRPQLVGSTPIRGFVTVSDRKGRTANGTATQTGYRAAWVAPSISSLAVINSDDEHATADNQLVFSAQSAGTELLDYAWTIDGQTLRWPQPVVVPVAARTATSGESAPQYVTAQLSLTDTSNCHDEPTACRATLSSTTLEVPLRLIYWWVPQPGGNSAYRLALYVNTAVIAGATYAWSSTCPLSITASQLGATMTGACKVSATAKTPNHDYTVTVTPP